MSRAYRWLIDNAHIIGFYAAGIGLIEFDMYTARKYGVPASPTLAMIVGGLAGNVAGYHIRLSDLRDAQERRQSL